MYTGEVVHIAFDQKFTVSAALIESVSHLLV